MAKEVITGAEALMRSLKNEDVKTIFGYPKMVLTSSFFRERISASAPVITSFAIYMLLF